ncbi:MAG: cysteine peptidase family C39 domain-containing protein [bacterium]|nr:cysteine peptidase family C39 domain-containing protein [bacterium]
MLKLKPIKHKYAHCGPACLQMVLHYFGINTTQKKLAKIAGTNEIHGTSIRDMEQTIRSYGFRVVTKRNTTTFDDLRRYVNRLRLPVIVNWYSTFIPPATGHYSVVTHIDRSTITLMDPEISKHRKMKLVDFNQVWFDFEGDLAFRKPPLNVDFRIMIVAIPKTGTRAYHLWQQKKQKV